MRNGRGQVRGNHNTFNAPYPEHDQIGLILFRYFEDLLRCRSVPHYGSWLTPQFGLCAKQVTQALERRLFQFFWTNQPCFGVLDNMQQREMRLVFLRQCNGVRRRNRRSVAEVCRVHNLSELGLPRGMARGMWPHRENRTRGPAQNLLRNRPQNEFSNSSPPARAHHNQIGFLLGSGGLDPSPNPPFRGQDFPLAPPELVVQGL